jgi:outer membrane lipoprotein-sorting protein
MKRTLILLVLALCLVGCESAEQAAARKEAAAQQAAEAKAEQEKAEQEYRAKIESLKKQKILNIRITDTTMDFILEDGTIVTMYSYQTSSRNSQTVYYYHHLGVK